MWELHRYCRAMSYYRYRVKSFQFASLHLERHETYSIIELVIAIIVVGVVYSLL